MICLYEYVLYICSMIKYNPTFIQPDNMKVLGFDLVSNKDGYLKYINDGTKHRNPDYGKFPESKGKITVFVNTTYSEEYFFLGITNDGETRTVYNGICKTEEFLLELLNNIR